MAARCADYKMLRTVFVPTVFVPDLNAQLWSRLKESKLG